MSWLRFAFNFSGRLNRLQTLGLLLLYNALDALPDLLSWPTNWLAAQVLSLVLALASMAAYVRRAHDINVGAVWIFGAFLYLGVLQLVQMQWPGFKNSLWMFCLLAPLAVANVWLVILALGQTESNRFGDPPR